MVEMYKPTYTNLNLANMSFDEYLRFAEQVGILKEEDKQEELEDWQKEMMNKTFRNPVYNEILKLVYRENRNCIIFIQGKPGSGKSYLSLKLGEILDPTFADNLTNRVIFDKNVFFFRLLDPTIPLKKGNVIIMEELGTQMDSRTWYDFAQRSFNYIIQTFRYRNLIVIFNAPRIKEIDPRILGYINILITAHPVDRANPLFATKNKWTAYLVEENYVASVLRGTPSFYLKKFKKDDGTVIDEIYTDAPSEKVVKLYEEISRKWKLELNYSLAKEIAERYMVENERGKLEAILSEIMNNLSKYTKMKGERIVLLDEIVRHQFNLSSNEIKYIKQRFELEMQQKENIMRYEEMRKIAEVSGAGIEDEVEDVLDKILKK